MFLTRAFIPWLRRVLIAAAVGWTCASAGPLTTAEQVHGLSLKESRMKLPVKLTGVVTYIRGVGREVVIQDATGGVMLSIDADRISEIDIGAKIEVEGVTGVDPPTPRVMTTSMKVLGREPLPEPIPMSVARLLEADDDGILVECEDVIRAVRIEEGEIKPPRIVLEFGPANARLSVWISRWNEAFRRSLVPGTTVKVKGVLMRWKTVQWMPISSLVVVHEPSWVSVVKAPPAMDEVAFRELEEVPAAASDDDHSEIFRVAGVVNYSDPSVTIIGDGKSALWIHDKNGSVFRPGDRIEAMGFPEMNGPRSELEDAVAKKLGDGELVPPVELSPEDFEQREPMWMDGMRVRLKGSVVSGSSDPDDAPMYLEFGGKLLPVGFADRSVSLGLPETASEIEATGVLEAGLNLRLRRTGRGVGDYRLHVQDVRDLQVLRKGPWWTSQRVTTAFFILAAVAGTAAGWAFFLNRRVAEKSRALVREIADRREQEIVVAERQRLAGDLHDTLEQTLTGASLQLDAMGDGDLPKPLVLARTLLDRSREELRRAVWDLTPGVLEEKGFAVALETIAREQGELNGVKIECSFTGDPDKVPDRIASHLCRVAQESITNALKHGGAPAIRLATEVKADEIELIVADDGRGFNMADAPGIASGHFGINSMKERMRRLDGKLEIHSTPGEGTIVRACCPLVETATLS